MSSLLFELEFLFGINLLEALNLLYLGFEECLES
jgi:hypothetical protein